MIGRAHSYSSSSYQYDRSLHSRGYYVQGPSLERPSRLPRLGQRALIGNIEASSEWGWQRNFVPKKFRGIDSEWFPLFRGRKCSFQGIPRFTEESIPRLGTEGNGMKNSCSSKQPFSSETASERNSESLFLFLFHGTEFRAVFSSAEWF
jgi:hypothetical protein